MHPGEFELSPLGMMQEGRAWTIFSRGVGTSLDALQQGESAPAWKVVGTRTFEFRFPEWGYLPELGSDDEGDVS